MRYLIACTCLFALILSGCGEKESEQSEEVKKVETAKTQETIIEVAQNLKQSTSKAIDKAAVIAQNITEKSSEVVAKVTEETKKISETATQKMNIIKKELDSKLDKVNLMSNVRGKELYAKCAGCHGLDGKKKALNKSAAIRDWNEEKILSSLRGYKDGTYGGPMKALMTSQVKTLSDEDLKALSAHILTLK